MGVHEVSIDFKNENEYIGKIYTKTFKKMKDKMGGMFESPSLSCFVSGELTETEDPGWTYDGDSRTGYFDALADCVADIGMDGGNRIGRLLFGNTCRIADTGKYVVSPWHPAVELINGEMKRIKNRHGRSIKNAPSMMGKYIRKAVAEDILHGMEDFTVYGKDRVYVCRREDGRRVLVPWDEAGSLTGIRAVSFVDKIVEWLRSSVGKASIREDGTASVVVACVGSVSRTNELVFYFNENPVVIDGREIRVKIEISVLEWLPADERSSCSETTWDFGWMEPDPPGSGGRYVFTETGGNLGARRNFDLATEYGMRRLFKSFNIVFFMDESRFNRQGQRPKKPSEQDVQGYVRWCSRRIAYESGRRGRDSAVRMDILKKEIYNSAGLYLNGRDKEATAVPRFDARLFSVIKETAEDSLCDVYLYTSTGRVIGQTDLPSSRLCMNERHGGRELFVFRMENAATGKELDGAVQDLTDAGNPENGNADILAEISIWDLVEGIGADFFEYMCLMRGHSPEETLGCDGLMKRMRFAGTLRRSFVIVHPPRDKNEILLPLSLSVESDESDRELIRSFMDSFLTMCGSRETIPRVRDMLRDLFFRSMLSCAVSERGIFYAYLFGQNHAGTGQMTEWDNSPSGSHGDCGIPLHAKKMVYLSILDPKKENFRTSLYGRTCRERMPPASGISAAVSVP